MSSQGGTHQTSINTYNKCIYFLPTCREAGKVDDSCVTANLKKSLSSRVDIHILVAFNIFREDFQNLYKAREVDQTSSAHKTNAPSNIWTILESSSAIESLEVEFASELTNFSPRLVF